MIEVWNKIDQLDEANREQLLRSGGGQKGPPIAISAITGEGIAALAASIENRVSGDLETVDVTLAPSQLGSIDWLYRNGDVVARSDNEDGSVSVTLRATAAARAEIENRLRARG